MQLERQIEFIWRYIEYTGNGDQATSFFHNYLDGRMDRTTETASQVFNTVSDWGQRKMEVVQSKIKPTFHFGNGDQATSNTKTSFNTPETAELFSQLQVF